MQPMCRSNTVHVQANIPSTLAVGNKHYALLSFQGAPKYPHRALPGHQVQPKAGKGDRPVRLKHRPCPQGGSPPAVRTTCLLDSVLGQDAQHGGSLHGQVRNDSFPGQGLHVRRQARKARLEMLWGWKSSQEPRKHGHPGCWKNRTPVMRTTPAPFPHFQLLC